MRHLSCIASVSTVLVVLGLTCVGHVEALEGCREWRITHCPGVGDLMGPIAILSTARLRRTLYPQEPLDVIMQAV